MTAGALCVLIVEDSQDDALILLGELRRGGYEPVFERVETPEAFRDALAERNWDLVIADWHLPNFSAPEALAILKASGRDLPFLIVSGYVGEAEAVTAMKAGAHDFIGKSSLARLVPAVARELGEAALRRKSRLLETALAQAEKMEIMGRFAGQIASEFDRVLVQIGAACRSVIAQLGRDSPARAGLQEIQEAAERAGQLTLQLIALSSSEPLQHELVDLNALIGSRYELLRRLAGAKADLTTKLESNLGRVSADPSRVEQLILCLIVKARDTKGSGNVIALETANAELDEGYKNGLMAVKPGPYVVLSIAKGEPDIQRSPQGRPFEPFPPVQGTGRDAGFGMAMVYQTVKQCGGDIRVENAANGAVTFKVYLPRVEEPAKARPVHAAPERDTSSLGTVLVAGGDEEARRSFGDALSHAGYSVLEARDGAAARLISRSYSSPIDLLLTDIVLADMSGSELAAELLGVRPRLRVLYACSSGDADTAMRAGCVIADARRPAREILEHVARVLDPMPGAVAN
jgi:two-component system, cell cycle sensor histidine kinase and response regulator CckA